MSEEPFVEIKIGEVTYKLYTCAMIGKVARMLKDELVRKKKAYSNGFIPDPNSLQK